MKVRLQFLVPGILLLLIGLVWILQGADVMKGNQLMSGKPVWLVIGIVVAVAGLVLGYFGLGLAQRTSARRSGSRPPRAFGSGRDVLIATRRPS